MKYIYIHNKMLTWRKRDRKSSPVEKKQSAIMPMLQKVRSSKSFYVKFNSNLLLTVVGVSESEPAPRDY